MGKALTFEQSKNLVRNRRVEQLALSNPCVDCKNTWHPRVMTFDHVGRIGKVGNISHLRTFPPAIFDLELSKCDVVCSNCHQMREYMRDLGKVALSRGKQEKHSYYTDLLPYLEKGALLNKRAFKVVAVWGQL